MRAELGKKYDAEVMNGVKIAFKQPDGKKIEYKFSDKASVKVR